jgi:response regulator NasT
VTAPRDASSRRTVLLLNEEPARLDELSQVLSGLGYEPVVSAASSTEAGSAALRLDPVAVLVGRRGGHEQALGLITAISQVGICPVVALLAEPDARYVGEAARSGAWAFVVGLSGDELRSSINLASERFAQYRSLQEAFERRAIVEQAKGILMARHGIDQSAAFDLLRAHARRSSRKLVSVAEAVIESHQLLPAEPQQGPSTLLT